jgi:DNA primase
MLTASRRAGFSDGDLLAAGLVQRSKSNPGQVYDRFRERIMFPSADARGRVLGFGARAMRENQQPKYLNTSESDIYHKRSQLFGVDLARAAAARTAAMILVEGYTDVLALHQAGIQNSVGIMGTSLTEEQVRELERIVTTLELCLDADRAGQDAMLRAARLAAGSKLELRVVALPEGTDPAEIVQREGAIAMRERVEASVPFVVFEVERILERSELRSAEGRDRALTELRPALAELPASVLRDELMRRIAGRLELSEARLASLLAGGAARPVATGSAPLSPLDSGVRAERTFVVFCIALPEEGSQTLASIDPDQLLTSQVYRRAARHLIERTTSPLTGLPPDDGELATVIADAVERAERIEAPTVERLEHARLVLERARLDRAMARARAAGGPGISALAREREDVLESIRRVVAQLEQTV